jgi:hypothetical protein
MGKMRNAHKSENLRGIGPLIDIGVVRKMILKRISKMWDVREWIHLGADSEQWRCLVKR